MAGRMWWMVGERTIQATVAAGVAWLVSMPLVLYHFEQFNPLAIPLGVLLSPLVVLSLLAGFLKVLLTAIVPWWAAAWAAGAAFPAVWLRHAVGWAAHVPGIDVPVGSPPIWWVFACYAAMCVPLLWRLSPNKTGGMGQQKSARVTSSPGADGPWQ